MKEYEIWVEGYIATGESGVAQKLGSAMGNNFDEAVENYINVTPNTNIEANTRNKYISNEAYINKNSNWNIWACNIYDNEVDARKAFG